MDNRLSVVVNLKPVSETLVFISSKLGLTCDMEKYILKGESITGKEGTAE